MDCLELSTELLEIPEGLELNGRRQLLVYGDKFKNTSSVRCYLESW